MLLIADDNMTGSTGYQRANWEMVIMRKVSVQLLLYKAGKSRWYVVAT